ncbi:hypothetical protein F5Y09DRAFT_304225 [Xylaria sp. FL1042]|nr:hypothetical protein F5Y09DRAFT_304225 [Xylaria sp. FL1042]
MFLDGTTVRYNMNSLQWSQTESNAIQQWRGMTSHERSAHQPRRQHREYHIRNIPSVHSDAELSSCNSSGNSSSDSSTYSRKKARDVVSHLKYLVRNYLRQTRSSPSVKDSTKKLTNQESFVPSPKITFLIDRPTNLVCQICQQARLKLAVTAEDPGPDMACILPCGHIACNGCMNQWLDNHTSCPFCRATMTHKGCKHKVRPRLLAQDTIFGLPPTLSNGGKIGTTCFKCIEKDRRRVSVERWAKLAEDFKAARRNAEKLGTDAAKEEMRKAQKAFEQVPEDDYMVLSGIQLHQW